MKRFVFEFEDGSANATGKKHDGISMTYSGDEHLARFEVDGLPYIYGNPSGLVKLGELLIQIGMSEYKSGYHLHIREDFSADKDEILIIGISDSR